MLRLRAARRSAFALPQLATAFLLTAICLIGAGMHSQVDVQNAVKIAILVCLLLLWNLHLGVHSSRWMIRLVAVSITAWEVSNRIDRLSGSIQLIGALLAYLALWTFFVYHRNPGLQPVATMALVTSAAVLVNPTVAIGCSVLALGSFAVHRHEALGGRLGFAFLLFTPATLCTFAVVALGLLGAGKLVAYPLATPAELHPPAALPAGWLAMAAGQALIPIVILCARLVSRQTGSTDLLFLLMLFVAAFCTQWFPALCNLTGVWLMALGGSAFLLTNALDLENSPTLLPLGATEP